MKLLGILLAVLFAGSAALAQCPPPDTQTCDSTISPNTNIATAENVLSTGKTLCLHGGTYGQKVTLNKAGVAVVAVKGETPIVDGAGISVGNTDSLFIVNASAITVDGLTIRNSSGRGLEVRTRDNLIENTTVSDIHQSGLIVTNWFGDASHNTFSFNTITRAVLANTPCSTNGGWESAINHYNGGSSPSGTNTWANNTVTNSNGEGMTVADNEEVHHNTFRDNYSVDVYLDGVVGANVHDNTISESEMTRPSCDRLLAIGVGFADEGSPARSHNNTVSANTITGTKIGINFWNSGSSGTGLKNNTINDNTVSQAWNCGICLDGGAHSGTSVKNDHISVRSGATTVSGVNASGISYVAG